MKELLSVTAVAATMAFGAIGIASAADQPLKIGFAPPVYDTLDYFGQFAVALQEEMEKQGVDYRVHRPCLDRRGQRPAAAGHRRRPDHP